MTQPPGTPRRRAHRHGDLRRALVSAGVDMAREGGPDAVVLREATRRAGVVPNAAYRHFADRAALLHAVCDEAMAMLAAAMVAERALVPEAATPAGSARARLRAIGLAYVTFAQEQPGLFRTAFSAADPIAAHPKSADADGSTPFGLLADALDELVDTGALPPARRPHAEFSAWSAVHGLAMLLVRGPLRGLDQPQVRAITGNLLTVIERGL